MKQILGFIPARGGSKSIPHKNIALLSGLPLLCYTCQAALASRSIHRVFLSTDDEKIASVGKSCGVEVPFLRPSELAQDTTPSVDVALHALEWINLHEKWVPDILVLLQPTSPLRRTEHIDESIELFVKSNADTLVSVVEVPHRYSPFNLMRFENGLLKEFWKEPILFNRFRRQEIPPLYARNGPAILISKVSTIQNDKSFYGNKIVPYLMKQEDSVDIDEEWDLRIAECIIENRKGKA